MKYLSVDIETTGLNPENHQIMSIGVIVEDTAKKLPFEEIPKFHCAIVREDVVGGLFAINLNRDLIQTINNWNVCNELGKKEIENKTGMIFCKEDEVVQHLFRFLYQNNILDQEVYNKTIHSMVENVGGILYPVLRSNITKSHLTIAGKNFGTFDKLFIEKLY